MIHIRQAVILAGGRGRRLSPLTDSTPKPMVPIYSKPFLVYTIELLKKNGITKVLILTGYLHEHIERYFGDGSGFGMSITYSYSHPDTQTAKRLKNAQDLLDSTFLLLYGDNYWPLRIKKLLKHYNDLHVPALMTVFSNFDHSTKNNVLLDSNNRIIAYDSARKRSDLTGVDIGFFLLQKELLKYIDGKNESLQTFIPTLIRKKMIGGFLTHSKYYSLTDASRLPSIEKFFLPRKILFLDRDGVINKKAKKGEYITSWDTFVFLPDVIKSLQLLSQKNYELYIVTNQPGVARKKMSLHDLETIHANLSKELRSHDIGLAGVYACVHGWNDRCFCRKPNPGLLYQAASEHSIDLFNSYLVGDDERDILAGKAVGAKTFLITGKNTLLTVAKKYL